MKLDAKVKGGLAWAGLVVILAVPATDFVLGKPNKDSANIATTSNAQPAAPAVVAPKPVAASVPAADPAPATDPIETASTDADPVDRLLAKGKKLPSYISDADQASAPAAPAAVTPTVPTVPSATVQPPVVVANVAPPETPPVPLPRAARPHAPVAAVPAGPQPLIIDERAAGRGPVEPFPLSDDPNADEPVVTGDQLEEWDSGSLADYLRRKGLLSENQQSVDQYDSDVLYLDEAPPNRRARLVGPADPFFLF